MNVIIIENIASLINVERNFSRRLRMSGNELDKCCQIDDAYLVVKNDKIVSFGKMCDIDNDLSRYKESELVREDAGGGFVMSAFCDSHTHIVFPHTREKEFGERLAGMSYEQIAANGGGILNSAKSLDYISDEEIIKASLKRLNDVLRTGTGTIEIKSGYGLTTDKEIRLLRIIKELKKYTPVTIKSTFLGAHAFPAAYRNNKDYYVNMILHDMIPRVAEEKLAEYVDVFCERGFFSVEQTERIFDEAVKYGLIPRIHANQLSHSGAIDVAINKHCISADHLEEMTEQEILSLAASDTIATLLPGCAFFMDTRFPDAKAMIKAGATVALASDYNPGTSPSGNMLFMIALACIKMKMTPLQALMAATINGAAALGISDRKGSIAEGKCADIILTRPMSELGYMAYSYTENIINRVMLGGKWVV